jgi:hypothetical protein
MREGESWGRLYNAAILETDWSRIDPLIDAAESAISIRLLELSANHNAPQEEHESILKAVNGLKNLRNDVTIWKSQRT